MTHTGLSERLCAAADRIACASWCTDGDGHPHSALRGDQNCWGPQRKTILGLEDGAPALPLKDDELFAAPGISVYAFREWHALPTVKLNLYRPSENGHLSVDIDVQLTLAEARQLADSLVAVVAEIEGER
ncbi:hypothetical protein KQR54_00600 [Mycobacterium gordonae]|uniref:DUF6907 domain-containing protein n=1 Tax=Mycobacterium gordonae TaxID=1778 RepID=UPI00210F0F9F|nr:hypothetical protein [Mycobacterium gordonae]MCQ4359663.1 hypothetical protein [Mycobacterium gordonae]